MKPQTDNRTERAKSMIEPNFRLKNTSHILAIVAVFLLMTAPASASGLLSTSADTSAGAAQEDYYQLVSLPTPDDMVLEVGGLAMLPDGKLAVTNRRGEVWLVGNPELKNERPAEYTKFAQGLYEPLGLEYKEGSLYVAQRGELTKLTDTNGDDRADLFERVYAWPLSGHYHEYSYGPAFLPNGNMVTTGNVAFGDEKWWEARSKVPWRGWTMIITPEGEMRPFATGMRSPSGVMVNDQGDIFYAENQGDWIGSGFIAHLEEGDFTGNPAGLRWAGRPESPVEVRREDIVDSERPYFETALKVPGVKLPAVWIPHTLMGISTTGILQDTTGIFSPFKGHYFVADQGHALINRITMEKVDGEYQGAVFSFVKGLDSGALRMSWGGDKSMYVGMTDRGWASTGEQRHGLQRIAWNGKVPFEMKTIKAMPDGFLIEFTRPVDKKLAANPALYNVTNFTYMYRYDYGSPVINQENAPVKGLKVSEDGLSVRLVVDNFRQYYIHEVKLGDIRSVSGIPLLHDVGYYTLNAIPSGEKLAAREWTAAAGSKATASSQVISSVAALKAEEEAESEAETVSPARKRVTEMPASWGAGPDQTIRIGTVPGLKYDVGEIEVKAGSKVALEFNNNDDMLHNVVIVEPGTADEVGNEALNLGLQGEEMNYVPKTDQVLFHTSLLQPGGSETIYFDAPEEPGTYTYVCTFPGHHFSMRGTLVVK